MNYNDGYVYAWEYVHYDDLCHHGIKGMKWGIRRTAEQLGHYIKKQKQKKQRAEALAKARATREAKKKEEEAKKQHEEARQKALRSGNVDEVLKFKGEYTNEELNYVINRLNYEKRLSDIKESEKVTGLDKFNSAMNKADRVRDGVEKAAGLYDTAAKINNVLNKNHKLPVLNLKGNDKNKDDKDSNNKQKDQKSDNKQKDQKFDSKKDKKGKPKDDVKDAEFRETYGDNPNDWSDPKSSGAKGTKGEKWTRSSDIIDAEYTELVDDDHLIGSGRDFALELFGRR